MVFLDHLYFLGFDIWNARSTGQRIDALYLSWRLETIDTQKPPNLGRLGPGNPNSLCLLFPIASNFQHAQYTSSYSRGSLYSSMCCLPSLQPNTRKKGLNEWKPFRLLSRERSSEVRGKSCMVRHLISINSQRQLLEMRLKV